MQTLNGNALLTSAIELTPGNRALLVFAGSRTSNATIGTGYAWNDVISIAGSNANIGPRRGRRKRPGPGGCRCDDRQRTGGNDIAAVGGASASLTMGVAGRDIFVEAGNGTATIGGAAAVRDVTALTLTGPAVNIGDASAGDDITVASAGKVTVTGNADRDWSWPEQ